MFTLAVITWMPRWSKLNNWLDRNVQLSGILNNLDVVLNNQNDIMKRLSVNRNNEEIHNPTGENNGQNRNKHVSKIDNEHAHANLVDTVNSVVKIDTTFQCQNVSLNTFFKRPFPICTYRNKEDRVVSGYFSGKHGPAAYWEKRIVTRVMSELKKHPTWGFFDVGAHIGVYTIPALKLGTQVVAIEALTRNIDRLTRSVQLNNIHENLTLLHNAVYDVHTQFTFKPESRNVAGTSVVKLNTPDGAHQLKLVNEKVTSITFDDTLQFVNFKEAIMKIDIEGSEAFAFKKADKLLNTITFKEIYMEWGHTVKVDEEAGQLVQRKFKRGYSVYEPRKPTRNISSVHYKKWPWDIIWRLH
ncbi:unnamed protein product [Owenia fusiformis]|uniref:Methyltransferase FkbM domain-containing protein n=1 Tax=Owenia fusiformis TaxID=6347 RepID=A0A8J1UVQ9_OWEFU|nr:unnamed protein product [Owenia fusiformis]